LGSSLGPDSQIRCFRVEDLARIYVMSDWEMITIRVYRL
jgi:hypothetical protein